MLVSQKGTVCAASWGEGFTVYSANGKPLHTDALAGDVVGLTATGGFLMTYGDYLHTVNASGVSKRWSSVAELFPLWGVTADGAGGWFAGGESSSVYPRGIGIVHLDAAGNQTWIAKLPGYIFAYPTRTSFLRAPDGTLRVVADSAAYYLSSSPIGIAVISFAVD